MLSSQEFKCTGEFSQLVKCWSKIPIKLFPKFSASRSVEELQTNPQYEKLVALRDTLAPLLPGGGEVGMDGILSMQPEDVNNLAEGIKV